MHHRGGCGGAIKVCLGGKSLEMVLLGAGFESDGGFFTESDVLGVLWGLFFSNMQNALKIVSWTKTY